MSTQQINFTWNDYRDYLNWQAKQWEVKQPKPKAKKQGKKAQRKAK